MDVSDQARTGSGVGLGPVPKPITICVANTQMCFANSIPQSRRHSLLSAGGRGRQLWRKIDVCELLLSGDEYGKMTRSSVLRNRHVAKCSFREVKIISGIKF